MAEGMKKENSDLDAFLFIQNKFLAEILRFHSIPSFVSPTHTLHARMLYE
jgi:hypothetical protein